MDFSRKIILSAVIFVSVGALVYTLGLSDEEESDTEYLTKEMAIKGWQVKPIVSDKAVLDTLEANVTVFADYYKPGEKQSVNLYVGYYDSLEKSKMSHAPQVCFTAQGWIMKTNDKIMFDLAGQKSKVNRLVLEKGSEKLLVYFWYQIGSHIYADLFRMKLSLAGQKIVHRNKLDEGNAFVRVSTSIPYDVEQASKQLQNYANDVYQELPGMFTHKL